MTLAEYKTMHGLTTTELAARLGLSISTLHYWVSGARLPSEKRLRTLAPVVSRVTGGSVTAADLRPDLAALFRADPAPLDAAA